MYSIAFAEAFTSNSTGGKAPWYFCFYAFFCFLQFTLFVYKFLIIAVENFHKYLWIQHKKTQPVDVMSERLNPFSFGKFTLFVYKSLIIVDFLNKPIFVRLISQKLSKLEF